MKPELTISKEGKRGCKDPRPPEGIPSTPLSRNFVNKGYEQNLLTQGKSNSFHKQVLLTADNADWSMTPVIQGTNISRNLLPHTLWIFSWKHIGHYQHILKLSNKELQLKKLLTIVVHVDQPASALALQIYCHLNFFGKPVLCQSAFRHGYVSHIELHYTHKKASAYASSLPPLKLLHTIFREGLPRF